VHFVYLGGNNYEIRYKEPNLSGNPLDKVSIILNNCKLYSLVQDDMGIMELYIFLVLLDILFGIYFS